MKFLVFVAFIALGLNEFSDAIEIACTFKIDSTTRLYTCEAKVKLTGSLTKVDRIIGWHIGGMQNSNVEGINIINVLGFSKFPRGFSGFFPKIKKVVVKNTSIVKITDSDMSDLPADIELNFDKAEEQNIEFENSLDVLVNGIAKDGSEKDLKKVTDVLVNVQILLVELPKAASESIKVKLIDFISFLIELCEKIKNDQSATVSATTTTTEPTTTTTPTTTTSTTTTTTTTAAPTTTKGTTTSNNSLSFAEQLQKLLENLEKTIEDINDS
jgi:hypothetical protein